MDSEVLIFWNDFGRQSVIKLSARALPRDRTCRLFLRALILYGRNCLKACADPREPELCTPAC